MLGFGLSMPVITITVVLTEEWLGPLGAPEPSLPQRARLASRHHALIPSEHVDSNDIHVLWCNQEGAVPLFNWRPFAGVPMLTIPIVLDQR